MESYSTLPAHPDGPPYNAWGLYGPDDELGRLNLITAETVRLGHQEIKLGVVVNLKWAHYPTTLADGSLPLDTMPLNPARAQLEHRIIHRGHCNDDHVSFNTQCSTQWDGLRHYPYLDYPGKGQYTYYGGMSSEQAHDPTISRNGTQNYVKRPITSRAHLLDIAEYLQRHSLPALSHFSNETPIQLETLRSCATEEGLIFQPGDILLVRTGWTEAFYALSEEDRQHLRTRKGSCGVSQSEGVLEWHWENGIAAVASDTVAYECFPAPIRPSIHEVFLSGWGMPIGELFDLRELAAVCEREKRYTFFFTSMPLYINGGIASPANAQAIL